MNLSPIRGVGLGIRQPHLSHILEALPDIPWFEALADNYLCQGGLALKQLETIRAKYPMTLHCVGMNLGSVDPLDRKYLEEIKGLVHRFSPAWISDHLSWSAVSQKYHHDLLPLPYTEDTIEHVVSKISMAQEILGQRILVENASSYIGFRRSEMTEWEFLKEVATRADCLILLDVNNIYVNSVNHGFLPSQYLEAIPKDRVRQFHLAGYDQDEFVLIDTHGSTVSKEVWDVYESALKTFGPIPTIIERDNAIPEFSDLLIEMDQARDRMSRWS